MISRYQALVEKLKSNYIARAMAVLVGGAASAHAITAVALPVLSRLYSPQDFSALAVFNSIYSVLSIAACLRYDVAVPIPRDDRDGFHLLVLAILSALAISVLLMIPAILFPREIARLVDQPLLARYFWLLPPGVFLAASASAWQNWFVRIRGFNMIAKSRIAQSGGAVALQLGAAALKAGPIGLLVGAIFNTGGGAIILGGKALRQGLYPISAERLVEIARRHVNFPKYSALEALCNMAAVQAPVVVISALAHGPEPGYVLLAFSVLQAPMALFGISIGQIYLSHAPEEYRNGRLAEFTVDTTRMLIRSGMGPLLAGGIAAPFLFEFIFGPGWARAGMILAWMTPWFVMQFLTSPISMALIVTGHQRRGLALQMFNLALRVGSVYLCWLIAPRFITEAYALSGFVAYLVYYIVVMRTIEAPAMTLMDGIVANLRIVGFWIVLSLASVGVCRAAISLAHMGII